MLTEVGSAITTDVLRSTGSTDGIRDEWMSLWQRSESATAFQSPAWIESWYRHIAGGRMELVTIRKRGELVGVVPLHRWTNPANGARTILFAGTGLTDYLDVLTTRRWEEQVRKALVEYLAECRSTWDECHFHDLPSRSCMLDLHVPAGWVRTLDRDNVCPVLTLPRGAGSRAETLPDRLEKKLAYYERRLVRDGRLRIESMTGEGVSDGMKHLFELHGARWRVQDQAGVLTNDQIQRFHVEAAHGLDVAGALRLYLAWIDDRPAAAWYGFSHADHTGYYLSGFDPDLSTLSPGMIVVGHALDQAVREGARTFDFLRGAEPYKYRWGAVDSFNYHLTLTT